MTFTTSRLGTQKYIKWIYYFFIFLFYVVCFWRSYSQYKINTKCIKFAKFFSRKVSPDVESECFRYAWPLLWQLLRESRQAKMISLTDSQSKNNLTCLTHWQLLVRRWILSVHSCTKPVVFIISPVMIFICE